MEAAQREADNARGCCPEWERTPNGGQPYERAYGEPDDKVQCATTRNLSVVPGGIVLSAPKR